MSDFTLSVELTPNPNALKFVSNVLLIEDGKVTFKSANEVINVPLLYNIMHIVGVEQVHVNENYLTVSKYAYISWQELEPQIAEVFQNFLQTHKSNIALNKFHKKPVPAELLQIDALIELEIRPYLRNDGGDVEVISHVGDILLIRYEGACGTCPSSGGGTLAAIQNMLRANNYPTIEVKII